MRTTLTLEDDVAARVERLRRQRRAPLKSVINEALRLGLEQMDAPARTSEPYRTPSHNLGKCLLPNLDNIAEVLAVAEGEAFR